MASERQRLLELALESLENKKKQIDTEIAELSRELRSVRGRRSGVPAAGSRAKGAVQKGRRSRFSKEERLRRSQRMKAYWENWRKQRNRPK